MNDLRRSTAVSVLLLMALIGCAPDGPRPCQSSAQCEPGESCVRPDDGDVGTCGAAFADVDAGEEVLEDDGGTSGGIDAGPVDAGVDAGPGDEDAGPGDAGPPAMAANNVTVGGGFACARTYGHEAYCWGYNSNGQLGNTDTTINQFQLPTRVMGISDVRAIAAGENHACALGVVAGEDGIYCWGSSANGELGTPAGQAAGIPHRVNVDDAVHEGAVTLQGGATSMCVLTSDGAVWCWGPGVPGYTTGNPVRVTALEDAIRIHVSDGAICAKLQTGVRCLDQSGVVRSLCESGAGSLRCADLDNAESFSFTASNACRVEGGDTVGALYCAGDNLFGVAFPSLRGDESITFTPLEEVLDFSTKEVALGDQHACALGNDAKVRCWGRNLWRSTGQGSDEGESCADGNALCHGPLEVAGLPNVTDVDAARFLTCAVADDGAVWCWGAFGGQSGAGPERFVVPD